MACHESLGEVDLYGRGCVHCSSVAAVPGPGAVEDLERPRRGRAGRTAVGALDLGPDERAVWTAAGFAAADAAQQG